MRNNPLNVSASESTFEYDQNGEVRRSGLLAGRRRLRRHPGRVIASSNIIQPVLQPWVMSDPNSNNFSQDNHPKSASTTPQTFTMPLALPQPTTTAVTTSPGRSAGETVRQKAVALAVQEWRLWQQGSTKETDRAIRQRLNEYWVTGTGSARHETDWPSKVPWSAAFISWVMRRAGAGRAFQYSAAHVNYIIAARKNRIETIPNPFKAYRTTEVAPRIGDIVCRERAGSKASYDNLRPGMMTHCDIVVELRPGSIVTIGGNVSNSVSQTIVKTDTQGLVIQPGYFAIIRVGD